MTEHLTRADSVRAALWSTTEPQAHHPIMPRQLVIGVLALLAACSGPDSRGTSHALAPSSPAPPTDSNEHASQEIDTLMDSAGPEFTVVTKNGMSLSEGDIATILELAQQVGFTDIERVYAGSSVLPVPLEPCYHVSLRATAQDSDPTFVHRRFLRLHRTGQSCSGASQDEGISLGGWQTSANAITHVELRRVWVEDWHVDINVGEGVSYDTAVRLVTVLKTGTINVRRGFSTDELWRIDRSRSFIPRPQHDAKPGHALHEVQTSRGGAGVFLIVCAEGTGFVLISQGTWFA